MRKNLIIVNTGPDAVGWDLEPERNYDVHRVFWHPDWLFTFRHMERDSFSVEGDPKARKFQSVLSVDVSGYSAVALLDDDVLPGPGVTWSGIFNLFEQTGAHIGHPSLTPDSYWAHLISRQQKGWHKWREVNFMDLMAPMFSAEGVKEQWPHFRDAGIGWGLEILWNRHEERAGRSLVHLDATPVRHVRRVTSADPGINEKGTADYNAFILRHGLDHMPACTHVSTRKCPDPTDAILEALERHHRGVEEMIAKIVRGEQ